MARRIKPFEDHSRDGWGTSADPSNDQLLVGATIRIADALERIADLLDPEAVKKRMADADKKKQIDQSLAFYAATREQLLKRFMEEFLPKNDKDKSAINSLATRISHCWWNLAVNENIHWTDPLTPEIKKLRCDFFESINPLDIDLSTIKLGPKTRARLEAMQSAARATSISQADSENENLDGAP